MKRIHSIFPNYQKLQTNCLYFQFDCVFWVSSQNLIFVQYLSNSISYKYVRMCRDGRFRVLTIVTFSLVCFVYVHLSGFRDEVRRHVTVLCFAVKVNAFG